MKGSKLHIVGLEALDEQCAQLALANPTNPDYVSMGWFYMYCYKVLLCPKRYSHDWGACPYAHTNESARRRDPQRFTYSSCICPNTGKGDCPSGAECRYAHTLFEYWLHPARFRTQLCKAGAGCKRALCFFAHSQAELRQPDKCDSLAPSSAAQLASAAAAMTAAGQPMPGGGFGPACRTDAAAAAALDASAVVMPLLPAGLAAVTTAAALDSSSSNVSCATCQPGSSPTALNDYSGEFGPNSSCMRGLVGGAGAGGGGSSSNLQLSSAPVTAGLLAQMPMLAASQYPAVSAAAAAAVSSAGLVTSMPHQLQDLLQQRQQQQLIAGMAAMNLTLPVEQQQQHLQQPSALLSSLAPATTAAPIYASIMQGVPAAACAAAAPGYAGFAPAGLQVQQRPGAANLHMGFQQQQMYQPAAHGAPFYTWM